LKQDVYQRSTASDCIRLS